jgi:hypothetical protein
MEFREILYTSSWGKFGHIYYKSKILIKYEFLKSLTIIRKKKQNRLEIIEYFT